MPIQNTDRSRSITLSQAGAALPTVTSRCKVTCSLCLSHVLHFKPLPAILTLPHTPGPKKDSLYLACTVPWLSSQPPCSQLSQQSPGWSLSRQLPLHHLQQTHKREYAVLAIITTTPAVHAGLFHNSPLPPPQLLNILLACSQSTAQSHTAPLLPSGTYEDNRDKSAWCLQNVTYPTTLFATSPTHLKHSYDSKGRAQHLQYQAQIQNPFAMLFSL